MKAMTAVAALAAVAMLWTGASLAQTSAPAPVKKDCPQPSASVGAQPKSGAPATISGEVVNVDKQSMMVTIRGSDGATHEFRASQADIDNFKKGDKIEAKLRAPANC
jgi:hypothetical protein